jgi:hypothetical protein
MLLLWVNLKKKDLSLSKCHHEKLENLTINVGQQYEKLVMKNIRI